MSLSQQLADYDSGDATLPMQYPDFAIDPGTLVCVDFLDPQCYSSGAVPAAGASLPSGTTFNNLVASASPLALAQAWPSGLGTGGIQMAAALQTMTLPNTLKLGALTAAHFGFGGCIKMPAALPSGTTSIGGFASSTAAANVQWLISILADGRIRGTVGGVSADVPLSAVNAIVDFFFEATLSGGVLTLNAYKNGVLVSQGTGAQAALPVPSTTVVLGVSGGGSAYTQAMGSWARFVFTDFTVANTKTPAQYAADEYSQIANARFS